MPHNDLDPTANTDKFRAFVEDGETNRAPAARRSGPVMGVVVAAVVGLVAVVAVAWLLVSG